MATGPRDLAWRVGDASRCGRVWLHVIGPTTRSAASLFGCWRSFPASSSCDSKTPVNVIRSQDFYTGEGPLELLHVVPTSEVLFDELPPGQRADDGVLDQMSGRLEG